MSVSIMYLHHLTEIYNAEFSLHIVLCDNYKPNFCKSNM